MKNGPDMTRVLLYAIVGLIMVVSVSVITGQFVYDSHEFEATITKIEYVEGGGIFGSTSKIVRLSDGSVLQFSVKLPKQLKEGHTYILEYRAPYFLASNSLVIVEEIK